ncbi:MAG: hypothetical protein KF864_03685 [Phycisphaeraceae bacterium]|nr:hypothetical protein [Phycisphaeraceae bacterium]
MHIPSLFGEPGTGTPQDLFCTAAGTDFTINLAAYSWSTDDWVIHIYDCASPTSNSIGKITITGDPSGLSSLAVMIAGSGWSWSDNRDDLITSSGCVNFSGLTIDDLDVRAKTRVSVAIAGDLTQVHTSPAGIHANQIVRIQAEGRAGPNDTWIGGNIAGDITADGAGTLYWNSPDAIGQVRAWNSISGTVAATAKNIAAVRVIGDPESTPAIGGISGDILALGSTARISGIYSTGPIGNGETDPQDYLKITAGNGIGEILTDDEDVWSPLVAVNVEANITAHATMLDDPVYYVYNSVNTDGTLQLLDVGGDLRGEIRAANLVVTSSQGVRCGIFVRGICYAPITIDYVVDHGNIIAQTFTGPIRIGRTFQGALVATGGAQTPDPAPPGFLDGHIPSITIGDVTDDNLPTGVLSGYHPNARGLVGIYGYRATIPDGEGWFAASPVDGTTALDACVRAQYSIGEADIASLTIQTQSTPGSTPPCTKHPPAVEAPVIGSLYIKDLATGTVWSGQHEEFDPDSGYAAIDDLRIGFMRRYSAVRVTGWSSFVVEHNMFGDIHVPEVPEGSLIEIGGILGNDENSIYEGDLAHELCSLQVNAADNCDNCVNELSSNYYALYPCRGKYRNSTNPYYLNCVEPDWLGYRDNRGQIWVHESEAVRGQIIINSSNAGLPQAALWTGAVQVGETTAGYPLLEVSPTPSSGEWESPHYEGLSAALGGGAVGLAPFALHDEDCLPVNDDAAPTITIREFDRTNPLATPRSVKLRFYGPVRVNHATESPVKLTLLRFANGHWHESSISPSRFTVNVKRTTDPGFSREVEIHGNGTWKFPAGWYKVEPVNTGAAALRSDLVDSQPLVRDFEYYFELMPETASTGYDLGGCGCPADFNQDGGVDGSDVEAFLIAWEIGESDGDVNCDGGVDGSDVETFFYYWEDGGCD